VAATAGFHSTHLAWDPVPNATSYKIYPAGSAGVSSSTITPITVSASPYNGTSLPNWVAVFYRVSAVVGGQESPLSTEVSATPTAGYLVGTAFEANQFRVDVFHADELGGAALRSIPGAIVLARVDGVGLLYGVDCSSPLGCAEMGLFTASAQRIVLAANAGHFFGFVSNSLIGDRLVIRDSVSGTNRALVSFAKDGSDPRTLVSGCSVLGNFMTGPGCLLFRCNNGSGPVVWASDGAAPAVALPLSVNAVPRATDGQNALLVNGATGRLTTQRTDGSGTPKNISPDGAAVGDALLAAIDSTALLMTQTPDNFYDTWTIPFDGSGLFHPPLNGAGSPLPGLTPVTADHRHFVVTYPMDAGAAQWRTFLVPVDASDMNFINLTPAGASVFGAALFEDGNALVQRQNVGWQVMQVARAARRPGRSSTATPWITSSERWAAMQSSRTPPRPTRSTPRARTARSRPPWPLRATSRSRPFSFPRAAFSTWTRRGQPGSLSPTSASRWHWTLDRSTRSMTGAAATGIASST